MYDFFLIIQIVWNVSENEESLIFLDILSQLNAQLYK